MSAILGRLELAGQAVDPDRFQRAFGELKAYGPRHSEWIADGAVAVGTHLLRPAQTPSGEALKLNDELIVVADAILDNRDDLAAALELQGDSLLQLSDTDLIRHSYLKWGKECTHHLYGDYAFACIEPGKKHVFLARDHIGARPLYWSKSSDSFVFGTSVESFVSFDDLDWKIDQKVVAEYLANPFAPVSKTFFAEIQAVPAGGILELKDGAISTERWWQPSAKVLDRSVREGDTVAECRHLLEEAIITRTQSLSPVGSHFSGGIDSTGVAVIASRYLQAEGKQLVNAYAWSPPVSEDYPSEHAMDERPMIQTLADSEGMSVTFGEGDIGNYLDLLDRPMEFENETDLADELPVLQAAQRDKIEMMLSGWGGDELFSAHGAGHFGHLVLTGQFRSAKQFAHVRHKSLKRFSVLRSLIWRELIHPMLPSRLYHRFGSFSFFRGHSCFASKQLRQRYPNLPARRQEILKFGLNPNENHKRHLMVGHLTRRMEAWAAWSAPYGFQYRYPLTDRKLLEFLLTVSPEHLFLDNAPRGLARKVLADCVPAAASKTDLANEKFRDDTRHAVLSSIAKAVQDGHYDDDCPWIDGDAFRGAASKPKDQADKDYVVAFAEVTAAARVWALYRRAKANNWV